MGTYGGRGEAAALWGLEATPEGDQMADTLPEIKHVVLLMLENRSFDHMLGGLPGVDGASAAWTNSDGERTYAQTPIEHWEQDDAHSVDPDPKHETLNLLRQLQNNNSGFVADYAAEYPDTTPAQRQKIMSHYPNGALGPLHTLATNFAVCQRWHASVPGPTWTNRLFALSGTSLGRVLMPGAPNYGQPSLFFRLFQAGRSCRVYYGDVPLALLFDDQRVGDEAAGYQPNVNYYPFVFFEHHAAGKEKNFPEFVFIEPRYVGFAPNDDHPPHNPFNGQRLIAKVYNALRANDALWKTTLFVILYDEHGGLADHVPPPTAIPPDAAHDEYTFDRLGVRVPAVLVSPWLARQVLDAPCDHTSLLRSLTEKWGLGPMGARTAQATDVFAELKRAPALRTDTPKKIGVDLPGESASPEPNTDHKQAVEQFARDLDPTPGLTARQRADNFIRGESPSVESP
jgi:phospholipase C